MVKVESKSSVKGFVIEFIKIVVISLAIIVPIRYFIFQPFFVRGESMEPNFSDREYLIVDEITYRFDRPHRGDVIVFKYPKDPSQYYIKRIIGLPNEKVEIKNGEIKIYNNESKEGIKIDESYLSANLSTPGIVNYELKEDEYFVLGDNRRASSDSRVWGPLPKEYLIGKVLLRGWPLAKVGLFKAPTYFSISN